MVSESVFDDNEFQKVQDAVESGGVEAACDALVEIFKSKKRYHELFDTRLLQTRQRLGLPVTAKSDLDDVPEERRNQVEEGYLDACREVGKMLLDEGDIRTAWMYLRTAGETGMMRAALERIEPDEMNTEAIVEAALYEGLHIERGFRLVLEHYGTCNAITTYESALHGRKLEDQRLVAGMLVEWLHNELLENLLSESDSGDAPRQAGAIRNLVAGQEDAFGEYTTHIDTSHLSSVVRFARIVENESQLALALDLTEYGARLHKNLQQEHDPPFADYYAHHRLFYGAQIGENVDLAIDHFRTEAEKSEVEVETTMAVEVYVVLLARIGRWSEAIEAAVTLIPPGIQTTGFAPSLIELARSAGEYGRHSEVCRERGDLLGFAVGEMESRRK
jgi:hypothetical protein